MLEQLSSLLADRGGKYLFGFLIFITIGFSIFIPRLGLDNSLEVWFLKDDPTLIRYEKFKELYGNDEVIIAWIKPIGAKGIFSREFINKIYKISRKLEKQTLIRRVLSITKAPYMETTSTGDLIIEDMVQTPPDDTYKPEVLKKRIFSNPLWQKLLLNHSQNATIMMIEPIVGENMDSQRPKVISIVKKSLAEMDVKYAGMGVFYEELNRISLHDSPLFTMLSYLILIVFLVILFRQFGILIAATGTMIISTLLFLGIAGLAELKFNMISAILPSLIIIMSLADIVHIFSHYEKSTSGKERLRRTLNYVLLPCFLTSLTTAVGFLSLYSSPMKVLKDFGIYAALGVMIEYFVAVLFSVVVLSRREKREVQSPQKSTNLLESRLFFEHLLNLINRLVQKRYKIIIFISLLLILVAFSGIMHLVVDTYSMNFLLDSNKIKQASRFIEKDYGFYVPLEIRIHPLSVDSVKSPQFLKKLSVLQANLDKQPQLQKSTSLSDVLKQLNRVLTDNKTSSYKIPSTRQAAAQELLLYESDNDNDLEYFVDNSYKEVRLTVRIPMVSSRTMKSIMSKVTAQFNTVFGKTAQITYGGYIPLYVKMMEYVLESQISSFLIAFIVIFGIMAIIFRSVSVILIGIVPNILPIFLTLGFMGWVHINLDIATVTIAAIAIGISVDDTIHFIFMYKKYRNNGISVQEAIQNTLLKVGKAIITTSVLLVVGYLVLIFASVKSVIFFGLLIVVTMISAVLCDLLLLPSLLLQFNKQKN